METVGFYSRPELTLEVNKKEPSSCFENERITLLYLLPVEVYDTVLLSWSFTELVVTLLGSP